MQNNTLIRIALCGLLAAAHATMAMETEPNSSLILSLESTPNNSPKNSPLTSPKMSPRNSQSGSQSPIDSSRMSPHNSPRQISIPRSNSQTSFTNTYKNVPCYPCINSRDLGNKQSEVTYLNDNNKEITKIFTLQKEHNNERYLYVIEENTQGTVEKYAIDVKPELSANEPSQNPEYIPLKDVKAMLNQKYANDYNNDPMQQMAKKLQQYETEIKPNLTGSLTSNMKAHHLPKGTIIYQGTKMEKTDSSVVIAITYLDENKIEQIISVNNTVNEPTYAIITDNGKLQFVIDLQNIENSDISPKSQTTKFIPRNNKNNSRYIWCSVTFIAIILLAYKYNQLPAAFEKILNQFFALFTSNRCIR